MKIGLLLIFTTIFFRLILETYPKGSIKRDRAEKTMTFIVMFGIVFFAAFRSRSVGADTGGYISDYISLHSYTYTDINESYDDYLFFYYVMKFFTMMQAPVWLFFAFIELVYVSAIYRFVEKWSSDKLYSICFFIILLYNFSLAGMKQVLAMALILHAYIDFADGKMVRFFIMTVLAYLTHPISMFFLIVFPLYRIRGKSYFNIMLAGATLVITFGSMALMTVLVERMGNEHFEGYLIIDRSYSSVMLIFYLLLLAAAMPGYKKYCSRERVEKMAKVELGCVIIACAFQYLASFSPNLFRLAYFFTPFYMVLLPNSFSSLTKSNQITLKYIVLFSAIFFYAYSSRDFIYTMSW